MGVCVVLAGQRFCFKEKYLCAAFQPACCCHCVPRGDFSPRKVQPLAIKEKKKEEGWRRKQNEPGFLVSRQLLGQNLETP